MLLGSGCPYRTDPKTDPKELSRPFSHVRKQWEEPSVNKEAGPSPDTESASALIFDFPELWEINCCLSHPVYGSLLWSLNGLRQGHYAKWNKPVRKGQILYNSTSMRYVE